MTDEQQPEQQPPDPSGDSASPDSAEDDLDALLDQASSLAGDLAADVGEPETSSPPPSSLEAIDDPGADVEQRLSQVEQDLETAGKEIGVTPATADIAPNETTTPTAADEAPPQVDGTDVSQEVPAFMDEFTESKPADASSDPIDEVDAVDTADDVPAFMDEFTQEGSGESSPAPAPSAPSDQKSDRASAAVPPSAGPAMFDDSVEFSTSDADLPTFDDGDDAPSAASSSKPGAAADQEGGDWSLEEFQKPPTDASAKSTARPTICGRACSLMSPAALAVCERGVGVLEAFDRPVARLNARTRHLAGWAALATLGTAIVVLIISTL